MPREGLRGVKAFKKDPPKVKRVVNKNVKVKPKDPPVNPAHVVARRKANMHLSVNRFIHHYNKNHEAKLTVAKYNEAKKVVESRAKNAAAEKARVGGTRSLGTSKKKVVSAERYNGAARGGASTKGKSRQDVST